MTKATGLLGYSRSADEEARKRVAWASVTPSNGNGLLAGWMKFDCDGRLILWQDYGQYTEYGWQIDHIVPKALGGSDHFENLRARHWRGNCSAGGLLGRFLSSC